MLVRTLLGVGFGNDFISFLFVRTARLILLLDGGSLRGELEGGVDGKMIGTGEWEPLEINERHVLGMEQVVQRIAQWRVPGVEGVEHAAAATGIEQSAETLEKTSGVGPGDVVEIADDDGWFVELFEFLSEEEEFDIAWAGAARSFIWLEGGGRFGMDGVEPDDAAIFEANAGFDGRDFVLHEKAELRIDERQATIEDHAVGVIDGALDDMGICGFQVSHLFGPPVVRFSEEDDVGLIFFEEAAVDVGAAILHEDVGGDEGDIRLAGAGHDFLAGKACVGPDLKELSGEGGRGEAEEVTVRGRQLIKTRASGTASASAGERRGAVKSGGCGDLEAWKIKSADGPMP